MSFVTHNHADIGISGSCLQGYIKASYAELRELFGEPTDGDGYKVDAEWDLRFDDGTVATVYNWKDGPSYCGESGTPVPEITDWHVGGNTKRALDSVQIALDLHREGAADDAKRNPVDELIDARQTLLESLAAQHGKGFADAVYFANLCMKQMEVFAFIAKAATEGVKIPEPVVDGMGAAMSNMIAQTLDRYCQAVGAADDSEGARKVTEWAERLSEVEQTGVKSLMREIGKKRRAA
jgi:hypothetical protein